MQICKTNNKLVFLKYFRMLSEEITNADQITSAEALQFDFDSIRVATNNFSEANKLG